MKSVKIQTCTLHFHVGLPIRLSKVLLIKKQSKQIYKNESMQYKPIAFTRYVQRLISKGG